MNLSNQHDIDRALQPDDLFRSNKRLIFLDANMIFIQSEMINDISRLAGSEGLIKQITERAMNGKIDFRKT